MFYKVIMLNYWDQQKFECHRNVINEVFQWLNFKLGAAHELVAQVEKS